MNGDGAARSRLPVIAVAAAVALLGGALIAFLATRDDEDRAETRPAEESPGGSAYEVLGRTAPANYVATRDWLVAVDGGDTDDLEQEPAYDAAPLRGGEKVSIDLPLDGDSFSPSHLVSDDEHAVIIGLRCAPPASQVPTVEERFCSGGEPAAFRVDPAADEVEEVELDPEVRALTGLLVGSSQRTEGGWWLTGWVQGGTARDWVLLSATPDGIHLAARWAVDATSQCVAGDAVYQQAAHHSSVLYRVPLPADPTDAVEPVRLPDLGPSAPAVALDLACTADGPFLAGTRGGPGRPEPTLHELHGGAWRERPDLIPPGAVTAGEGALSDHGGVMLTWSDGQGRPTLTVIPSDGSAPRFVEAGPGHVWHGSSGTRLGFILDEDDPGGTTTTLRPGPFPGLDHLPLW